MAKDVKGFLKFGRKTSDYRPVCERVLDYKDVVVPRTDEESMEQGVRCMDCGTPFCHWGCPVGNYIPEWNELMMSGRWDKAVMLLEASNCFPEITGRVCPALCEYACVLGINDDPVTVRENELAIIEHAFREGLVTPRPPKARTGKKVAVVGSGPAGMASAMQLNRYGHNVTVFEKASKIGGFMRFGIPDFKLEKWIIDRRIDMMIKEGVEFKTGVNIGVDIKKDELLKEYDAVCLAIGSRVPRDLKIEGRDAEGIHFAVDYLTQANMKIMGEKIPGKELIDAKGKKVVVIGGGDTGSDCVGTANRQGADCVVQIEVMPKPADCRTDDYPWPGYPLMLKTSSSHEEGAERDWAVLTKRFVKDGNKLSKLECVRVEFVKENDNTCPVMKEVKGSEFTIDADLVILAVGFLHPEHKGIVNDLALKTDGRGNVIGGDDHMTSRDKVFAAGDMRRGQSLIVWAIKEGMEAAENINKFLGCE